MPTSINESQKAKQKVPQRALHCKCAISRSASLLASMVWVVRVVQGLAAACQRMACQPEAFLPNRALALI